MLTPAPWADTPLRARMRPWRLWRRMRVMFASTRGAGHLGPLLPLATACKRAGHQVLVAAPRSLSACVARSGLAFWALDDPSAEALGAVWARVPTLPRDEQNAVVIREVFARLNGTATLPGHRAAIRSFGPDVIVRESSEFGSALAAELEGVPHARIGTGLATTEEAGIAIAAPALDTLRTAAGLPADDGAALRAAPSFSWFPASLEEPAHEAGPAGSHEPARPASPAAPSSAAAVRLRDPSWDAWPIRLPASWWSGPEDPLVYVTFGSVAGGFPQAVPIFRAAIRALADLPVRALLTVGSDLDPATLPAPPNVHIERWVPQDQILPHAAAVVCHGGSGTTLGALAAGCPLVLIPLFADQPDNARRVAATGAGRMIPDASLLRDALTDVLEQPHFTTSARAFAQELRTHLHPSAALSVLADLAAEPLRRAA